MPRIQPLVPLLRPLAAPRAPSCQHLFRFSTASRLRAEQNSTTPKPTRSSTTTSSPKTPSNPQEASRAVDLAATEAVTDADSAQPPVQNSTLPSSPSQSSTQSASQSSKSESSAAAGSILSNLSPARYHVARSHNKNLPIYTDYKRGGNLHLTTVRKVTGDTAALRDELRVYLNKDEKDVKINPLNGHIVIKGHHRPEIATFLAARGM